MVQDLARREADLRRREADLDRREAAVAAREAALARRTEAAHGVLAAADERDAVADARDVAADRREMELDRAQLLAPPDGRRYGDDWPERRAAGLDREFSKDDRQASHVDRITLTEGLDAPDAPAGDEEN
jgi:hypothetical protein